MNWMPRRTAPIASLAALGLIAVIFVHLLRIPHVLYDPIPGLPPREEDRVRHPAGFSVIGPEGWEASVLTADETRAHQMDEIRIRPGPKARFAPHLSVARRRRAPDTVKLRRAGYTDDPFQGSGALIYDGPAGKYHAWRAVFTRQHHWFQVDLYLPHGKHGKRYEGVPAHWWPFLNSFRCGDTGEQGKEAP